MKSLCRFSANVQEFSCLLMLRASEGYKPPDKLLMMSSHVIPAPQSASILMSLRAASLNNLRCVEVIFVLPFSGVVTLPPEDLQAQASEVLLVIVGVLTLA